MSKKFILGISCFYHDSAACLVGNGNIIAAAQEERFTRKKDDANFPSKAINYCLCEADIQEELYMANQSIISEFWEFLKFRKRLWLFPIVLVLALLGALIVFTESSVIAPFIYALF
jgi:predicted NodU family carbamoyl transferase